MRSFTLYFTILLLNTVVITNQEDKSLSLNTWFMTPMLQKRDTDMTIKKRFFLYPFVYPYYYYSNIETTTAQPSYFWGRTPSTTASQPSYFWATPATAQPSYFWGRTPN